MKLSLAFGFIMLLIITASSVVLRSDTPEELILGKWEEVSWEIERTETASSKIDFIEESQKKEIYKNLIIHKAEIWEFLPHKQLTLQNSDHSSQTMVNWAMKGRGHILELKYKNMPSESYQVQQLTEDKLVIYFNFDLQMRGIVKMTFKKVEDNYAQKI